jgi:hypothetical protein
MSIIYTGIFFDLTLFERIMLLRPFVQFQGWEDGDLEDVVLAAVQRTHPRIFLQHTTLQFRPHPDSDHVRHVLENEGEEIRVRVTGRSDISEPAWALVVEPDPLRMQQFRIECANDIPHITAATAEGVSPATSNEVLARGYEAAVHPFTLTGRLGVFRGGNQ